jgi:hypothetical protein
MMEQEKQREIDDLFRGAANPVDPALLERVSASINTSLTPVRPLPPSWVLTGGIFSLALMLATLVAAAIGFWGIQKLSGLDIAAIFSVLTLLAWLASSMSVRQMIPGSARWMNPITLLAVVLAGWLAIDVLLFRDYQLGAFVPEGIVCLRAGLMVAAPTGAAAWLLLRRGFAVNPASAGLAAGTFAGLAGVIMLELHCPNLSAPHIMVWHTAVIPVSAFAGALLARIGARRS